MTPASKLDIRRVPGGGDPPLPLTRVDPGVTWIFHLASLLGCSLSIAGICSFQLLVDFASLLLTGLLGLRLHSPLTGALAALLYGLNTQIPATALLVSYYFWSVPLALVIAHLVLSASPPRANWLARAALLVLSFAAVWLRALWLPVLALVFASVWLSRAAFKWFALGLFVLLASYATLVLRARDQHVGDVLHTRSQLWHTLYIGLGAYSDWDQIRWLDEYAYQVAASAGVPQSDAIGYEALFRGLFLHEIGKHPFRYGLLLIRRAGDYMDAPRASTLGLSRVAGRSVFGWLSALGVLALLHACRELKREPVIVYGCAIAIWCVFLPPIPIYATETLGLWAVVVAVCLVEGARVTFELCGGGRVRRGSMKDSRGGDFGR